MTRGRSSEEDDKETVDCLDSVSRDAMNARCSWVPNNPDIVVTLHAIRVEILINYVMREVVPPEDDQAFQYWLRFEFGFSGNPHGHGLAYVPNNPEFDLIVKDKETLDAFMKMDHPEVHEMRTWDEAEEEVAAFYEPYVNECHPCKDEAGAPLWNFSEPLYTLPVSYTHLTLPTTPYV